MVNNNDIVDPLDCPYTAPVTLVLVAAILPVPLFEVRLVVATGILAVTTVTAATPLLIEKLPDTKTIFPTT
jgi:hypothetical protein